MKNYNRIQDLADAVHNFPEYLMINTWKAEEYWNTYIKPYNKKWDKKFLEEWINNIKKENTDDIALRNPRLNMKISFDLDDTLILTGEGCLYEDPPKFPFSIFYKERLRKGTFNLCKELSELGWDICVYTTSERSVQYIRRLFAYMVSNYKMLLTIKFTKR